MNINKIMLRFFLLIFVLLNINGYAQDREFDIIGNWNSSDFWNNKSETTFTEDGYFNNTERRKD